MVHVSGGNFVPLLSTSTLVNQFQEYSFDLPLTTDFSFTIMENELTIFIVLIFQYIFLKDIEQSVLRAL